MLAWQLSGRKQWDLWHAPAASLPLSRAQLVGKRGGEPLAAAELGPPDVSVVLGPGDVLYVPRGVLHATRTVGGKGGGGVGPRLSTHLTLGLDSLSTRDFTTGALHDG